MTSVSACDPHCLICPRCGEQLCGLSAGQESLVARCENRKFVRTESGGLAAEVCGQAIHVLGTGEGVAFALPISGETYDRFQRHERAGVVYREVGAIETRGRGFSAAPLQGRHR